MIPEDMTEKDVKEIDEMFPQWEDAVDYLSDISPDIDMPLEEDIYNPDGYDGEEELTGWDYFYDCNSFASEDCNGQCEECEFMSQAFFSRKIEDDGDES